MMIDKETDQTVEDVKYYELELKARAFDIIYEIEIAQSRISKLNTEKTGIIQELQRLYKYIDQNSQPSTTLQDSQNQQPSESQTQNQIAQPTIPKSSILDAPSNNQQSQNMSRKISRQSTQKLKRS